MGNYPETGKDAYKLHEKIGEGGYGQVFKATRLFDNKECIFISKECAIKVSSYPMNQDISAKLN